MKTSNPQEKPSITKREHPALQNMKFSKLPNFYINNTFSRITKQFIQLFDIKEKLFSHTRCGYLDSDRRGGPLVDGLESILHLK
jgi:hypothetical protein